MSLAAILNLRFEQIERSCPSTGMQGNNVLRYDLDENISRHAAVDDECCYEMESKYGWNLKRIEKLNGDILKADCVFEGETEFPNWYKEQEQMEDK